MSRDLIKAIIRSKIWEFQYPLVREVWACCDVDDGTRRVGRSQRRDRKAAFLGQRAPAMVHTFHMAVLIFGRWHGDLD